MPYPSAGHSAKSALKVKPSVKQICNFMGVRARKDYSTPLSQLLHCMKHYISPSITLQDQWFFRTCQKMFVLQMECLRYTALMLWHDGEPTACAQSPRTWMSPSTWISPRTWMSPSTIPDLEKNMPSKVQTLWPHGCEISDLHKSPECNSTTSELWLSHRASLLLRTSVASEKG